MAQHSIENLDLVSQLRAQVLRLEQEVQHRRVGEEERSRDRAIRESLLEQLPAIAWTVNTQLKFTYSNGAGLKLLNLGPKEMIGVSLFEFFHTEDHEMPPIAAHIRALRGQLSNYDFEWQQRYYQCQVQPLRNTAGEILGCVGLALDVTSHRQTEAKLNHSEIWQRRIFESEMIGILSWQRSGAISHANDFFLKLIGYTREELNAGKINWREITPPGYEEIDEQAYQEILLKGYCTPFEKAYVRRDGTHVPVMIGASSLVNDRQQGVCFVIDTTPRMKAQEALRETAERLEAIVRSAPISIDILDADGNVLFWNAEAERLFGWTQQEVLGRPLPTISESHRAEFQTALRQIFDGESVRGFETKRLRKDGALIDVARSAAPLRGSDGNVASAMGIILDITARKRAEDALRHREQWFRQIAENIPEVFCVMNRAATELIYISPAYERVWGRSPESLYQNVASFLDAVHPEDLPIARAVFNDCTITGFAQAEYRVIQPDGTIRWVSDQYFPVYDDDRVFYRIAGIATDITERKEYEQRLRLYTAELSRRVEERTAELVATNAQLKHQIQERERTTLILRESEARYRLLAEHSNDMISRHDLDGVCRYASPACRTLLGYEAEELIGISAYAFIHPEDVPHVRRIHERVLDYPEVIYLTCRVRHKDGTYSWVEVSSRTIRDPQTSQPVEIINVSRDISERKRAEQLAEELRADLAHVGRLSTMGELATSLAHELKQPLGAIVAFAEGAIMRLESNAAQPQSALQTQSMKHALDEIVLAAQRADKIIRRTQEFVSKGTLSHTTRVDIRVLIENVLELLGSELRNHNVELRFEIDHDLPKIIGDSIQIQQVILNLVRNAVESMQGNDHVPRTLVVRTSRGDGEGVIVSFEDSGCGVSPERLKMLFTPFFTTKNHGMGVGLSISKSIIDAHNGRLWATRNADRGMTFQFRLPLQQGS